MALSGFLSSIIDGNTALIIIAAVVVAGLLLLIPVIKRLKDMISYIYPSSRIRVKEANLIRKDLFDEMITSSSPAEVLSILGNTDYSEYIQNISLDDPKSIEISIDSYLSDLFHEIAGITPKKDLDLIRSWMSEWDARNLKYVIRNIHLLETGKKGMNIDELTKNIVRSPLDEKIKETLDIQTIDELMMHLEGTYFDDLKESVSQYRERKNLAFLENSVYKFIYEKILNIIRSTKNAKKPEVKRYFTVMIGAKNIKLLLRAKKDGIDYPTIEPFLIKGKEVLPEDVVRNFNEIDIDGIISELEGTEFYRPLEEALSAYKNVKSLSVFDNALDNLVVKIGKDISTSGVFDLCPIIGFLAVKTAEAENVKKIISAKYFDLPSDRIRPLIVTTS